jgi:hypothetical protein
LTFFEGLRAKSFVADRPPGGRVARVKAPILIHLLRTEVGNKNRIGRQSPSPSTLCGLG